MPVSDDEYRKYFISKNNRGESLFAGLWAIVNNAGISGTFAPTEWLNKEDFLSAYNVNVLGMTQVNQVFLELVKLERGRIINMSSVLGRFPGMCLVPYSMSKHAVEGYTGCLRYFKKQ